MNLVDKKHIAYLAYIQRELAFRYTKESVGGWDEWKEIISDFEDVIESIMAETGYKENSMVLVEQEQVIILGHIFHELACMFLSESKHGNKLPGWKRVLISDFEDILEKITEKNVATVKPGEHETLAKAAVRTARAYIVKMDFALLPAESQDELMNIVKLLTLADDNL